MKTPWIRPRRPSVHATHLARGLDTDLIYRNVTKSLGRWECRETLEQARPHKDRQFQSATAAARHAFLRGLVAHTAPICKAK